MGRKWEGNASLLGLKKTLEDEILDIMDEWSKDSSFTLTSEVAKDSSEHFKKVELEQFIRSIVYDVLSEMLGDTLIRKASSGKSFKEQLFWELEANGFIRNCKVCYFNMARVGKGQPPKDYKG